MQQLFILLFSDAVIISMVSGVVTLGTAAMTLIINRGQNRIRKVQDEIHKQINGMQDKLIFAEKSVSKAEGVKEGIAEEKAKNGN